MVNMDHSSICFHCLHVKYSNQRLTWTLTEKKYAHTHTHTTHTCTQTHMHMQILSSIEQLILFSYVCSYVSNTLQNIMHLLSTDTFIFPDQVSTCVSFTVWYISNVIWNCFTQICFWICSCSLSLSPLFSLSLSLQQICPSLSMKLQEINAITHKQQERTHTQTHTHPCTHACMHTHTQIQPDTHIYTRTTNTITHTHTQAVLCTDMHFQTGLTKTACWATW